jgi:hypothetical protein
MRRIVLLWACALPLVPLAACSTMPTDISTTPVSYADKVRIDEQGIITAELAYKTWRIAVETGVNAGTIKGGTATKLAELDNRIYLALQTVEAAYSAGNADSIEHAVGQFNIALTTGYTALGGK